MNKQISEIAANILYPKTEEMIAEEAKQLEEATKASDVIGELISTSWAGSNEEQMKAVQLLKGVALSDEEVSNKFMKALDKFTSGLNAEDYK